MNNEQKQVLKNRIKELRDRKQIYNDKIDELQTKISDMQAEILSIKEGIE